MAELGKLIALSFGYILPLLFLLGITSAFMHRHSITEALGALACVIAGAWFWIAKTDTPEIRYFVPFGTMAFTVLIPYFVGHAERMSARVTWASGVVAAPTVFIAALPSSRLFH
jgi:hypothetical protein